MPRVAVVQIEPSSTDPEGGLRRIEAFTADAAAQGAEIVAFPELLIPGCPRYVGDPFSRRDEGQAAWEDDVRYHQAFVANAQTAPGPCTEALGVIVQPLLAPGSNRG